MVGKPSLIVALLAVVFGMVNDELLQHVKGELNARLMACSMTVDMQSFPENVNNSRYLCGRLCWRRP